MGVTKTEIFTARQNQLAQMMKVLSHPARIAILQEIISLRACVCGSLAESLGLAQPTISQHLKELKNAGLIKGCVEGTTVSYCIDENTWARYVGEFSGLYKPHNIEAGTPARS